MENPRPPTRGVCENVRVQEVRLSDNCNVNTPVPQVGENSQTPARFPKAINVPGERFSAFYECVGESPLLLTPFPKVPS